MPQTGEVAHQQPLALEDRGFTAAPHHWLIGDDNCRARFDGVVDLLSKLRVDAEARCDFLGRNTAAPARHGHPSPRGAARSQRALPVGRAFQERIDVVSERSASVNLNGARPIGLPLR